MITAHASVDTAVEALRLGASDYIEKPFDHVALVGQKIETALRHKQAEHERNLLLEKLRTFQAELDEKDQKVLKQQSEIEMFNDLLEKRVKEATEDYRRSMMILESAIKSSRSVDFVLKLHAESLLEYAKTIPLDETLPPAQLRGLVTRLTRRLDAHV